MPFNRFRTYEGRYVDTVLGPEMRSTGEVMGIDAGFGIAYAKSQAGAQNGLPTSGTGVRLGRQPRQAAHDLPGQAAGRPRLRDPRHQRHGVGAAPQRRRGHGDPQAARRAPPATETPAARSWTRSATRTSSSSSTRRTASTAGGSPRSTATRSARPRSAEGIPCITTVQGLAAAVQGIEALIEQRVEVASLQEWAEVVRKGRGERACPRLRLAGTGGDGRVRAGVRGHRPARRAARRLGPARLGRGAGAVRRHLRRGVRRPGRRSSSRSRPSSSGSARAASAVLERHDPGPAAHRHPRDPRREARRHRQHRGRVRRGVPRRGQPDVRRRRHRQPVPRLRLARAVLRGRRAERRRRLRARPHLQPGGPEVQQAVERRRHRGRRASWPSSRRSTATQAPMGPFGAVVGATIGSTDEDLAINGPLLAPGFGAQGGTVDDVVRLFGSVADRRASVHVTRGSGRRTGCRRHSAILLLRSTLNLYARCRCTVRRGVLNDACRHRRGHDSSSRSPFWRHAAGGQTPTAPPSRTRSQRSTRSGRSARMPHTGRTREPSGPSPRSRLPPSRRTGRSSPRSPHPC